MPVVLGVLDCARVILLRTRRYLLRFVVPPVLLRISTPRRPGRPSPWTLVYVCLAVPSPLEAGAARPWLILVPAARPDIGLAHDLSCTAQNAGNGEVSGGLASTPGLEVGIYLPALLARLGVPAPSTPEFVNEASVVASVAFTVRSRAVVAA